MIVSDDIWNNCLDFISSLIPLNPHSYNFSFSSDSNRPSILKALIKNPRTKEILGICIDNQKKVFSQKYFFKDPQLAFTDSLNLIKLSRLMFDDNFSDNAIIEELADKLKSEALSFIGKHYPYHRKSLLKFRIIVSKQVNTLAIQFNHISKEVELRVNPVSYFRISFQEVLVIAMKYSVTDIYVLNYLLICYGAFLLLHELYHVLYRHCTDYINDDFSHKYENIIMDSYINVNLIFNRFGTLAEVREVLSSCKIPNLEINSGIGFTIDSLGKLNSELIGADKIQIDSQLKSFNEDRPLGYSVMQEFLSRCTLEDTFFVALAGFEFNRAYDAFSYPIRQFIKEVLDLEDINFNPNSETKSSSGESESNSDNQQGDSSKGDTDSNSNNRGQSSDDSSEDSDGQNEFDQSSSDSSSSCMSNYNNNNSSSLCKELFNSDLSDIPEEILDKILRDAAKEVVELNDSLGIESDDYTKSLLENLELPESSPVKEDWRERLSEIIEEAQGIDFIFNPDGLNRRYEGQLGRFELIPAIASIILAFDVSYSMSVDDYKIVLNYLEDFLLTLFSGDLRIDSSFNLGYIYWAGIFQGKEFIEYPKPIESIDSIFQNVIKNESLAKQIVGSGTDFSAFIRPFVSGGFRQINLDLLLVFTDGQFLNPSIPTSYRNWYEENKDKIIFILTTDKYLNLVFKNDSTCAERTIVFNDK